MFPLNIHLLVQTLATLDLSSDAISAERTQPFVDALKNNMVNFILLRISH
jgi:hypothetical protein